MLEPLKQASGPLGLNLFVIVKRQTSLKVRQIEFRRGQVTCGSVLNIRQQLAKKDLTCCPFRHAGDFEFLSQFTAPKAKTLERSIAIDDSLA